MYTLVCTAKVASGACELYIASTGDTVVDETVGGTNIPTSSTNKHPCHLHDTRN